MNELIGLQHFHGTIDKRECREMLREPGDFLLRNYVLEMDKVPAPPDCICVLTVGVTVEEAAPDEKALPEDYSEKNNCVTRPASYAIIQTPDGVSLNNETFPTIQALCDGFILSKKPLPNGGTLLRAVIRKPWQLLLSELDIPSPEVQLGKGSYGKVVKGTIREADGEIVNVAVKSTLEGGDDAKFTEMYTEARSMRRLAGHTNIIELKGVVVEKLPILLVIELFEGTSLLKALEANKVPDHMRFPIVTGIMYGLVYMHSRFYIHRDIAARNVMVSPDCKQVKIIDFGLAKHSLRFRLTENQKIPKKWLAPEVLKDWTFSTKSDVWAFAVTVWEVFHNGAVPYSNVSKEINSGGSQDKNKMANTKRRSKSKDQDELTITENLHLIPLQFQTMYRQMLSKSPRDRIEMGAIASQVEKSVIPALLKDSRDAAMIHVNNRPPFDPNFGSDSVPNNVVSSDSKTDRNTPKKSMPSPPLGGKNKEKAVKPSGETPKKQNEKMKRSNERPQPPNKTEKRSKSKNKAK